MLKILENSGHQLKLRLRGRGVSTTICTLDRQTNIAEVARSVWRVPYRRERVALSDLTAPVVRRREHQRSYQPMLEVRIGPMISLGGFSKSDALEAARAIRDFLKPPVKIAEAAATERDAETPGSP